MVIMLRYGSAYELTSLRYGRIRLASTGDGAGASIDPPRLVFNKPWYQWGQCSILAGQRRRYRDLRQVSTAGRLAYYSFGSNATRLIIISRD